MITVVVGKEIEKIKSDFESYLNGLNMVGEISYSQYSELYDEGTKQIQKAYELGKAELEKENAELEKEAEEIAKDIYIHHFDDSVIYLNVLKAITVGAQKGAEFGYKKGFEECAKARLNVTTISDCPIKDEWHYIKNRDFPVREDYYVIACHSATGDFTDRCQWLNNEWWDADGETRHFINEKVYAWKERSEPPEE